MKRTTWTVMFLGAMAGMWILGASGERVKSVTEQPDQGAQVEKVVPPATLAPVHGPEADPQPPARTSSAAAYQLDWYSINGGGTISASSPNYNGGFSIGQSVAGEASSTNYSMGIGFWYGAGGGGGTARRRRQ
jgi:hypothetical protein